MLGYAIKDTRKRAEAEMAKLVHWMQEANLRIQEKRFKFSKGKITILAGGKHLSKLISNLTINV